MSTTAVFCAWCWRSLHAPYIGADDRRYCDERCAGHDPAVPLAPGPSRERYAIPVGGFRECPVCGGVTGHVIGCDWMDVPR